MNDKDMNDWILLCWFNLAPQDFQSPSTAVRKRLETFCCGATRRKGFSSSEIEPALAKTRQSDKR